VLAGVQADLNASFGGQLNFVNSSTPQSQLAASIAAIVSNTYAEFLFLSQMFDPAFTFGRYQDALARLYALTRDGAEPTVVQCNVSGAGVTIPVGALARDTSGNIYAATVAVTIPAGGGTLSQTFAAVVPGPTVCPAGTLNQIYQAIPGWDTITNPADGVVGSNTETRAQFEARRQATLQGNARSALAAVRGAILAVAGVLDAYTAQNNTGGAVTLGGVTLPAHSFYAAVVGGVALDVATAIFDKLPPGPTMVGNTTVSVQDTSPPYVSPFPTYSITFEIPTALPVLFAVSLANGPDVPSNAVTLVKNAIISAFAGGDGGPRAGIGSTIYASRFITPVAAIGTWVRVVSLQVGAPNAPDSSFQASISGSTMTVSATSSGSIALGGVITDTLGNIIPGTTVLSYGSYNPASPSPTGTVMLSVTYPLPVPSETMSSTTPNANDVVVRIDQTPVLNAADILVTLV
jgi:uncharacterized phage protein gp47/JayE